MDRQQAASDLEFVRDVLRRTHARVDTHAFHFVLWGAIVLVWYPLANWLQDRENGTGMLVTGAASLALGFLLGFAIELRLKRRPRLPGANTFLSRQIGRIVYSNLIAAAALSAFGPATGFMDGPSVPVIWGLVYANMAFMTGVIYTREFLYAGIAIFGGCLLAIVFHAQAGYILGPFMGLGMIIPGVMGERRVARLRAEDDGA